MDSRPAHSGQGGRWGADQGLSGITKAPTDIMSFLGFLLTPRPFSKNVMYAHHPRAAQGGSSKIFFLLALVAGIGLSIALLTIGAPSGSVPSTTADLAKAQRLQKVGSVTIQAEQKDRPLASGEEVFKAQCAACHGTGVSGAPVFGNAAEWGPRLAQGFEALVHSALQGKGAMSPQGGGQFTDLEIARGVAYMANAGGGQFDEPQPAAEQN